MAKIAIGIPEKNLTRAAELLSFNLSDEMTLYVKTRKFHWNVAGESFMELHKLFENQYNIMEKAIDEVAERIGKLGKNTIGTMQEFTSKARLKESPGKYPNQKEMLKELLTDHESLISNLRKDVDECAEKLKDAGTADFLTGLMEQHETMAWIIRRYLS